MRPSASYPVPVGRHHRTRQAGRRQRLGGGRWAARARASDSLAGAASSRFFFPSRLLRGAVLRYLLRSAVLPRRSASRFINECRSEQRFLEARL
jgi:hypothetical protein